MTDPSPAGAGTSAYASGGGGVVLEHVYGATVLAALLIGTPFDLLGDSALIDQVAFQARHLSPVDDLVITGTIAGPEPMRGRIAIAVRRDPVMARSDEKFVKLLGTMLEAVAENWDEVTVGACRLGLVVAAPHSGAQQTATLTDFARSYPDAQRFREAVMAPGTTTGVVRKRLGYLEAAVAEAIKGTESDLSAEVLTWRLLTALRVVTEHLEGDVAADRTSSVGRLQAITEDAADAAALFDRLVALAGHYVPAGAEVDLAVLHRDLAGQIRIKGSLRYSTAWSTLDRLAQRARSRTRTGLDAEGRTLELDRGALRSELKTALRNASGSSAGLVVTGDPDVGKSALALALAGELALDNSVVHVLNLRDLPTQTLELEHLIGGSIGDVLAAGPVAEARLLLIDGAESVLEAWATVFSDLTASARAAGIAVVAVARGDAARAVSAAMSPDGQPVEIFFVPPLDTDEQRQVATSFQSLARFSTDQRSAWLLGRLGLIDLVLQADVAASLPDGALSEADVFAAVWARLVRRDERHGSGEPGPDAREQALLALAAEAIAGQPPVVADLGVLPSLRSDGLLLAAGPTAAWSGGDQFATDLIRDFAIARLLVLNGFDALVAADGPRWAIRAAVLALQARLLTAADVTATRESLQTSFDAIAAIHGDRWSDLVDEATLTLGSSPAVLDRIWPTLVRDGASGFARLVRLTAQRYTEHGVADPIVADPLVALYLARADELTGVSRETLKAAGKMMTAFLRGLITHRPDQTNPTRVAVRERALAAPSVNTEQTIERLGLLGPDLDERAEAALRGVANQRPHLLSKVVESPSALSWLANHRADLLLALAESYYIEHPHPTQSPFAMPSIDDGIRRHTGMGVGFPFAGWYVGPFRILLHVRPLEALAFINRMLDHAANISTRKLEILSTTEHERGLEIDLPNFGRRSLAGDARAWSWYRGTTFGPYPCISALLALEVAVDAWHEAGVPLETVTYRLLEHSHNLATLGLAIGFLVRHLDEVTTELDVFLTQPAIWELEFGRLVGEHGLLHAQRDDPEVRGFDKRRYSFADAASTLTVQAMLSHDDARIAALENLADQLVANATDDQGAVDPTVHVWASGLRASSFEATVLDDGRIMLQAKPPHEVEAARQAQQAEMNLANEGYRLLNAYAINADRRPTELSQLDNDIAVGRQLAEHPPPSLGRSGLDAIVALAATALIAHGEDRHQLSPEDLEWAAVEIIDSVVPPPDSSGWEYSGSWYSPGADRSAATALPSLLLPSFNEAALDGGFNEEDLETIEAALMNSAASPNDEVRRVAGGALAPVWAAPCRELVDEQCRHQIAYQAVEHGLRDCRLGPWAGQRRDPQPITGELVLELVEIDGEDLLIDRLTGPITALAAAVGSNACIEAQARTLLDAVLAAHRRAAIAWSAGRYTVRDEGQSPVVTALVDLHRAGYDQGVDGHVRALIDDPAALWQLLRLLAELATYDHERRGTVFGLWPGLMASVLDEIDQGRDPRRTGTTKSDFRRSDAFGALVLHPQLQISDKDPDATLTEACANWISLGAVRSEVEQWLPLATGSVEALDAIVSYLRTLPPEQQVEPGLTWVDRIIAGHYDRFSGQTWHLATWLSELRSAIPDSGQPVRQFRSIVDGFANAGDDRFVAIQRAEERPDAGPTK